MAGKIRRAQVCLNAEGIAQLPFEEIKWILRGADEIIVQGGRTLLAKILKGSKDKKIIERKLDNSPVYGYFKDFPIDKITTKIDWLILNGYLKVEYDYRLPLLAYTDKGWVIEMDTYSDELLAGFDRMLNSRTDEYNMAYLKDRNRQMIFLLLDKVKVTKDPRYISILRAWEKIECRKVKKRIRYVIAELENA